MLGLAVGFSGDLGGDFSCIFMGVFVSYSRVFFLCDIFVCVDGCIIVGFFAGVLECVFFVHTKWISQLDDKMVAVCISDIYGNHFVIQLENPFFTMLKT